MPSALLFILLGVMWAVVLVPMWLRKHDENNESRSVDRFSRALGSLSSRLDRDRDAETVIVPARGKVPAGRAVLMPGRPAGAQDHQVTVSGSRPATTTAARRRPVGAATRRRRLLVGSLLVTLLVLVAGLLNRVPLWVVVIPAVLTLGVLVTGRRQAARTAEMARRRARRAVLSEAARLAEAEHRRGARTGAARIDAEVIAADVVDEAPFVRQPVPQADSWDAVPTTLPTYVTAPAATRVPRVIDRTTPGSWSGAAMLDQARSTRHEEPADDSGMRVESFEICVPRERERPAAETYSERYLDTEAGTAELAATDDGAALEALLDDERSGVTVRRSSYRRAAG